MGFIYDKTTIFFILDLQDIYIYIYILYIHGVKSTCSKEICRKPISQHPGLATSLPEFKLRTTKNKVMTTVCLGDLLANIELLRATS